MKNRLFRLRNKSNNQMWVISKDENEAFEIALQHRFVRSIKNIRITETNKNNVLWYDIFSECGNDMTEVDEKTGVGCVYIDGKNPSRWMVN